MGMIPDNGYLIGSNPDYGYPNGADRRKVLLWSKQPWQEVDTLGSSDLPSGRFITGITYGIRFAGICIPWADAHVRTGRKDRVRWQDHRQYLDAFAPLANSYRNSGFPACVTGDFNQRIPRSRQPLEMAQRLAAVLGDGWQIVTADLVDHEGHQLIDHVATCGSIHAQVDGIIPKRSSTDQRLSDHVGIIASIRG